MLSILILKKNRNEILKALETLKKVGAKHRPKEQIIEIFLTASSILMPLTTLAHDLHQALFELALGHVESKYLFG